MKKLLKRSVCDRCETTFSLYENTYEDYYIVKSEAAEKHYGSASQCSYDHYLPAYYVWLDWADCECLPADKERGDG